MPKCGKPNNSFSYSKFPTHNSHKRQQHSELTIPRISEAHIKDHPCTGRAGKSIQPEGFTRILRGCVCVDGNLGPSSNQPSGSHLSTYQAINQSPPFIVGAMVTKSCFGERFIAAIRNQNSPLL